MINSNARRTPVKPAPTAPLDSGMPWQTLIASAGGGVPSRSSGAQASRNGIAFFAVLDAQAGKEGLGRILSASTAMNRDLLAAALKKDGGPQLAEIRKHLLALSDENKAGCGEKSPRALHLYMGLDRVKKQDRESAATFLRDLSQVATSLKGALHDSECEQMLTWISDAWTVHARLLDKAPRSTTMGAKSAENTWDVSSVIRTTVKPGAPMDSGIPWKSATAGAGAGGLGSAGGALTSRTGIRFFAVLDEGADEKRLGQTSSAQAVAHRNLLVAELKKSGGPDLDQVTTFLQALIAENKASCREKAPNRLHLYMGLGPVKKRDLEDAARYLRGVSTAAGAITGLLDDPECEQMLKWITNAWKDHAKIHESGAQARADAAFSDPMEDGKMSRAVVAAAPTLAGTKSLAAALQRSKETLEKFLDMNEVVHPRVREICTALAATPEADLKTDVKEFERQMAALPGDTLAQELATQALASTAMMQRKCTLLARHMNSEGFKAFRAALDEAHRMQTTANDDLRDLLLKRRIGKTQVKHLGKLVYARAMTSHAADGTSSYATLDEVRTMHRHLQKVIGHLTADSHTASSELQPLLYVNARLQKALAASQ